MNKLSWAINLVWALCVAFLHHSLLLSSALLMASSGLTPYPGGKIMATRLTQGGIDILDMSVLSHERQYQQQNDTYRNI